MDGRTGEWAHFLVIVIALVVLGLFLYFVYTGLIQPILNVGAPTPTSMPIP